MTRPRRPERWLVLVGLAIVSLAGLVVSIAAARLLAQQINPTVEQQVLNILFSQEPISDSRLQMTIIQGESDTLVAFAEWRERPLTARPTWIAICPRDSVEQRRLRGRGCKATRTTSEAPNIFVLGATTFEKSEVPQTGYAVAILDTGQSVRSGALYVMRQ